MIARIPRIYQGRARSELFIQASQFGNRHVIKYTQINERVQGVSEY
jgi:hypothetical protein